MVRKRSGWSAEWVDTLTITPPSSCFRMTSRSREMACQGPRKLLRSTASQLFRCSRRTSPMSEKSPPAPALFTKASMRPNRFLVSSIRALTLWGRDTSASIQRDRAPRERMAARDPAARGGGGRGSAGGGGRVCSAGGGGGPPPFFFSLPGGARGAAGGGGGGP